MTYKIVGDSCLDFNEDLEEKLDLGIVPLNVLVNGKDFVDNKDLDKRDLMTNMKAAEEVARTASPSPADYIKEYEKGEDIYVVTLSSQLSSSYNNAVLAKDMLKEKKDKFIHVFDSLSASVGQTLIAMKIKELLDKGIAREELVSQVDAYISEMNTLFTLESYDNLVKNGRMSKLMANVASALSIKPIMGSTDEGSIRLIDKVRGKKRSFNRLVDIVGEEGDSSTFKDKILAIAHCNALSLAEDLKEAIEEKYNFKEVIIVETGGLSTVYADDGGIILAY